MALDIANTVLNASPYFDDYSEDKNFHRVLFRPSVAVQARELNQVQSILQNQIERFGQHVFKDGTIIKGCGLSYLERIDYVSVNDQFDSNTSLSSTNTQFVNAIAVGSNSGVVAQIISAREGFKASTSPARFFIQYTQPGFNNQRTFDQNETISLYQPGKSYIDKVVVQVNTVITVNTTNFPVGSKLVNNVNKARGFIINAYANTLGNYVEMRNVRKTFAPGDTLVLSTDAAISANVINVDYESYANSLIDTITTLSDNAELGYTSLGFAYGVAVSPGIIFHKGHFVKVDSHTTIINENAADPSGKILYFKTEETVVKETDDSSLYDNASGTTNINAPGAHRLKLTSTLIARNKNGANTISNTDIAFPIVEFGNNGPIFQKTNTEYNIIGDELNKRTYEESGHYVVKPFTILTKPHGSDPDKFVYEVGQGLSYVKGKRIEFLNNQNVEGRKGVDTISESEQPITMAYGNYVVVDDLRGYFPINQDVEVRFYNAAQDAVSGERLPVANTATGTIVGYANIRAITYIDSNSAKKGSHLAQYRLYIFNYRPVGTYTFQDARSVVYNNGVNDLAFADLVLTGGVPILEESSATPLLFSVNAKALKNLRNSNNVLDTNYYYTAANTTAQLQSTGILTFGIGALKGILGFTGSSNADELKVDIHVADANAQCATTLVGTTSASATNVITGTGTLFTEDFIPGECIRFTGLPSANTHRIVSITNATSMVINTAVTVTANTYTRVHLRGSVIALNPAAGTKRTMVVNPGTETATINLGNNYTGTTNVVVRFQALNNEANTISKQINRNSVVIINTANNVAGTTGPWLLGVPDVLKLNGVFIGSNSSNFVTANRVSDFVLDNGQRDTHYDHAKISLAPKTSFGSLPSGTHLLVQFDCFTANVSGGEGFFSVESYQANDTPNANTQTALRTYEIPTYTTTVANTTVTYDLRDVIDFRPYKANTANITTSFTSATINPPATNTFNSNTTVYNPYPGSSLTTNFTYYLGRKDRLVLTPEGAFKVEEGLPGLNPRLSPMLPEVLNVAEVTVPAYPSLSDTEKSNISRRDNFIQIDILTNKRFTMRDISVLEKRIERLEYYTTLNMLESIALSTMIADQNGDQRFQNGFFVDPFNSHAFGRTEDPGYRIAIDEQKGLLRPLFEPQVIEMEFDTNADSYSNVQVTGNMVTLAYTHEVYIDQPYASDPVNVSGTPIAWKGTIDVRPTVRNDVEFLARAASVGSTSKIAQAYENMSTVTPGITQYGWWREGIQNNDDYNVKSNANDARNATSIAIETNKSITTQSGEKVQTGIVYLSKERVYAFKAVGLKPNTIHYLFINDNNNSQYAALGELSSTPNAGDETFVTRSSPWGTVLETDSRGEIIGKFIVPALALKSGTHKLTLRNRNTLNRGIDESFADAYFTIDITLQQPPVVIQPNTPGPPDANTPANTTLPPPANSTTNTVVTLPEAFARFTYTGETTVTAQQDANGYIANGTFTLTFTDDSFVKNGSITAYEWNFNTGDFPEIGILNVNTTVTGVGPHTVTFSTDKAVQDVLVTLTITDSAGEKKRNSQPIRLTKLVKPPIVVPPPATPPTVPNVELTFVTSEVNQVSDPYIYNSWNVFEFRDSFHRGFNTPYLNLTYDTGTSLGTNTVVKVIAKPSVDYQGYIGWTVTPVSATSLRTFTQANLTQVYVEAGGSGYSNSDTIRFSNGQVDAYATVITDAYGSIRYVELDTMGNFSNGAPVTQQTFTANSTVYNNFPLSVSSTNTSILVTVNGLVQSPGVDYQVTGGGSTLNFTTNLNYLVSPDIAVVSYDVTGVTPGTGFKTPQQIKVQIANTTAPANSTNGNTSGGSGAVLTLVPGVVFNSTPTNSPRCANDSITLYSNTGPDSETIVLVKADFYLSNGYANSIGNTSQHFTLKTTSAVPINIPPINVGNWGGIGLPGTGGGWMNDDYMKYTKVK
jgi:Domain of unknown function (DUF4815)